MPNTEEYAILVVDDDEPIVKNMRRVLKRKGFNKVISALNAEQGITLLEDTRNHFFLIMSDQRMPGLSGSEFLEKSILLSPESRRMLITGYSDFKAIVDAVNKGEIHQYISKPWNNDDLLLRIQGELDIYKQFQERKRLFNITRHQNAKLFEIAADMKKNLGNFAIELKEKKDAVAMLIHTLRAAKEKAGHKDLFLGLDELLSRTIFMNQKNLSEAFAISRTEVIAILEAIARRNHIPLHKTTGKQVRVKIDALSDDTFEIIDQIIGNVVQSLEPTLFGIGQKPGTGVVIDDYKELPDFATLAFNEGYINQEELEIAQGEGREKEDPQSSGLSIEKVLISKGFLQRKDLSLLFAKMALIATRLSDRKFAKMLLGRDIATKKDIDWAFRKQLNYFENRGVSMCLKEILTESKILPPEFRDDVMTGPDSFEGEKNIAEPSADFSSEFGAFDLQVSDDQMEAWIRVPKNLHGTKEIGILKQMMKTRGIKYGIILDAAILNFIEKCTDPHEKFVVAKGVPANGGKPGRIIHHFNTEHEAVGVIREDGSIDFSARGDSPFVEKGQLLAEKKPMEPPKPGMNIFGETFILEEMEDISLQGGEGVKISKDGLELTALIQGQPTVDAKGVISVLEQFTINGDVDFKTGNINYIGNVLVTGRVKEGFKVECDDLTANDINGATILIRGDLKVSNGIVNSHIETQGNVQAKFLNNAKIFAHGNMMITREIMGSRILISGALTNEAGRITASFIAARMGLSVRQIGTEMAESSTIKMGTNDHILWVTENYDNYIKIVQTQLDEIILKKHPHDQANNTLHVDVASQTFTQERLTQQKVFLEKAILTAKSKEEKQKLVNEFKEIEASIRQADERIKTIFEVQDGVMREIKEFDTKIEVINQKIAELQKEKEGVINRLEQEKAIPVLKVHNKLFRRTKIMGTMAVMTPKEDLGRSKLMEIDSDQPDTPKLIVHQIL